MDYVNAGLLIWKFIYGPTCGEGEHMNSSTKLDAIGIPEVFFSFQKAAVQGWVGDGKHGKCGSTICSCTNSLTFNDSPPPAKLVFSMEGKCAGHNVCLHVWVSLE